MDDRDDLSQGEVPSLNEKIANFEISEEAQRRKWKTYILWATAITVVIFYGLLIYLVLCHPLTSHWVIGLIAAVPTLLAAKLIQLVSPIDQKRNNTTDSPWFQLVRELVQAIKER